MGDGEQHEMPAATALHIVQSLTSAGVEVVVAGGWAVDALLGEQTRPHGDLDVWAPAAQFDRLIRVAVELDIDRIHPWAEDRPWNFVLHDGGTLRVDLHLHESLADGDLHYGSVVDPFVFPAEALTGEGEIAGTPVVCEAPAWVRRFHTGYEVRPVDRHDMRLLCERFGFDLPDGYD